MKIIEVKTLAIPEIKVIKFERFMDHRGFFTEPFRRSDIQNSEQTSFLKGTEFVQMNESFSHKGAIRGLHFQWNPYMGKLVRTLYGHMVDLVMDIRKGSATYGKIIAYDMPENTSENFNEAIWVPPGFAHGNFFIQDGKIEYMCTGEYSPGCEAGISPFSADIDWSMCDPTLKDIFDKEIRNTQFVSDKDKNGLSVEAWTADPRSENFIFGKL